MSCSEVPDWYLRHRVAVIDLRSSTWSRVRAELVPPGYEASECMRRLVAASRLRRVSRGLYIVIDPVRETSPIAIASGLFAESPHYVTTDAALAFHGLIDQPLLRITVVLPQPRRPIELGAATVRPVVLGLDGLRSADAYASSVDGFPIRVAAREQAVADALAEPHWMFYFDLLPEVLRALSRAELEQVASRALTRSTAAGQRLGYILEEAGVKLPKLLVQVRPVRAVHLRPGSQRRTLYSTRWRIYA